MVRWTLLQNCALRRPTGGLPAESAARQLAGLVEASRIGAEGRVFEGLAWHSDCELTATEPGDCLAFPAAEPAADFGGAAEVAKHCHACPANLSPYPAGVAGCWGFVSFRTPAFDSSREVIETGADETGDPWLRNRLKLGTGQFVEVPDLVGWFQRQLELQGAASGFVALFGEAKPAWYALWIGAAWNPAQTVWLKDFLVRAGDGIPGRQMAHLSRAVAASCASGLQLCFERVPSGTSDGSTWSIGPHCGGCGWERAGRLPCMCCGESRAALPERRRRVMGLRPWLRLVSLVGQQKAVESLARYREFRRGKPVVESP